MANRHLSANRHNYNSPHKTSSLSNNNNNIIIINNNKHNHNNKNNNADLTTLRPFSSCSRISSPPGRPLRRAQLISLLPIFIISQLLLLLSISIPTNASGSNLPLVLGILRTYQVSACDGEQLSLKCDSRTVINMVVAQYGHPVQQRFFCRNFFLNQQRNNSSHSGQQLESSLSESESSSLSPANGNAICPAANHLRYLFLQKIESTCREKNFCQLELSAQNLGLDTDPCPHQTKFAEVAFKCRPNKFINKITCEGSRLKLVCNEEDRIVIFSAFFGSTSSPVPECPRENSPLNSIASTTISTNSATAKHSTSNNGTKIGDCQVSYATESVMSFCHGRRSCNISADTNTFGVPVCPVRLGYHLKVVYTCVSKRMLKNNVEFVDKDPSTTTEATSTTTTATTRNIVTTIASITKKISRPIEAMESHPSDNFIDDDYGARKPLKKNSNSNDPSTASPINELSMNRHHPPQMDSSITGNHHHHHHLETQLHRLQNSQHINCSVLPPSMQVVGFVSDWISAIEYIKKNRERFILYLLVSLFASLVCFLAVLSVKLYHQKSSTLRKVREQQAPITPFEILDFDDDDLDDYDDNEPVRISPSAHYPMETVDSDPFCTYGTHHHPHRHHQSQHFVPQDTPSVSILTEPRPLLYSTLRKKASIKSSTNWGRTGTGSSRLSSPSHRTNTTLPKSILVTNRNSSSYYGSSIPGRSVASATNPKRLSISNSGSANQSLNSESLYSYGSTGTVRHKKDPSLARHSPQAGSGNLPTEPPVNIQVNIEQHPGNNSSQTQQQNPTGLAFLNSDNIENTEPKSLSQNLNNYFM